MFASSSFVFLLSAAVAMADSHQARNHHAAIAKRINNTSVEKRDTYTGREMTWYPTDTGPDACTGKNHQDSDYFVAMGYDQFGDGGCCGKQLRITYNGKSAVATCVDECATCPEWGQLDLTKGLFKYFTNGDLDIGVIYASWSYVDGDDDDNDGPTTTKKTTTTHHTTSTTHHTTSTTKKEITATPTHTSSSEKHSSAKPATSESHADPSSSSPVEHSSSADLPVPSLSEPASPTEDPLPSPALPSPSDGGVANVGSDPGSPAAGSSDPSTDSGDSGADSISGALTGSNDGTSLRSNKFTVAIAAVALAALQAL